MQLWAVVSLACNPVNDNVCNGRIERLLVDMKDKGGRGLGSPHSGREHIANCARSLFTEDQTAPVLSFKFNYKLY